MPLFFETLVSYIFVLEGGIVFGDPNKSFASAFFLQSYQNLCERYPSFRERSENVDLVVEISLQPWKVFKPDGVNCKFFFGFFSYLWQLFQSIHASDMLHTCNICCSAIHVMLAFD
jgi:hypothetical protein